MNRFSERSLPLNHERRHISDRHAPQGDDAAPSESRQFVFMPIVGPAKQAFGSDAEFRAGWEENFSGDANATARVMLDNWMLFGLEEMNGGRPVFLSCTRDTLMSGFFSLLPSHSTVIEISQSLEPDAEVQAVCRSLKAAGYRFALSDFESAEKMHEFLHLAEFIKVEFGHIGRRERASMLRRLRLTGATLIAQGVQAQEEFRLAREEGFGLFQGYFAGERISFVKKRDVLDPIHCTRILEALQEIGPSVEELAELIDLESGIQCRVLRRANWVTPSNMVINATRDAVEVLERSDLQKIVTLSMTAASARRPVYRPADHPRVSTRSGADTFVRWKDGAARTSWWYHTGREAL